MNPNPTAEAVAGNFRYRAFISYSQAADGRLAPALQSGLQRLAKPWYACARCGCSVTKPAWA